MMNLEKLHSFKESSLSLTTKFSHPRGKGSSKKTTFQEQSQNSHPAAPHSFTPGAQEIGLKTEGTTALGKINRDKEGKILHVHQTRLCRTSHL